MLQKGIKHIISVELYNKSKNDIFADILKLSSSQDILTRSIFETDPTLKTSKDLLENANLTQFNSLDWVRISEDRYTLESDFSESKRLVDYDLILRKLIDSYRRGGVICIFMIGDYSEIIKAIDVVPNLLYPGINIAWDAFTEDPYTSSMTGSFKHYDTHILNEKWMVGGDGTGKLSKENILWLANNFSKSETCLGILERKDYLQNLEDYIPKLYLLTVSIIVSTKSGGAAAMKMPIPNNPALDGIVGLFGLFFDQIRFIKLKSVTPDNDTIYLMGNNFTPLAEIKQLANFLLKDNTMDGLLYAISQNMIAYKDNISFLQKEIQNWINKVIPKWDDR